MNENEILFVRYIDAINAGIQASLFKESLEELDVELLIGEAYPYGQNLKKDMEAHAQKIEDESDVERQRAQFDHLSQLMIKALKSFGSQDSTPLYVQFCPMAFDDQGAEWISKEKAIQNPYFGDIMLKCGVVRDSL